MFDPFAGRHPSVAALPLPLPVVGLRTAYPIRCPYCRDRLVSKYHRRVGWWRWCRRHQCVVSYDYDDEKMWVAALW
jgi:hypothetical protein